MKWENKFFQKVVNIKNFLAYSLAKHKVIKDINFRGFFFTKTNFFLILRCGGRQTGKENAGGTRIGIIFQVP